MLILHFPPNTRWPSPLERAANGFTQWEMAATSWAASARPTAACNYGLEPMRNNSINNTSLLCSSSFGTPIIRFNSVDAGKSEDRKEKHSLRGMLIEEIVISIMKRRLDSRCYANEITSRCHS